jgi:beta-galactosidase GanA
MISTPHLRKQGSAIQLIIDGRPFLVIGGELHNSSSSSLEYMKPIWERLVALHLNTVLAAVSWELVEPQEGVFDFALVDGLLHEARRHGLRLILLWFGSWKNGMSSYIPGWVKRDAQRFPRVKIQEGKTIEVLSTLAEANWQADSRAFAALMTHLAAVDGRDRTVIMVQVENEVGVLGDSRDRSPAANAAFTAPAPSELMTQLVQHRDVLGAGLAGRWQANGFRQSGSWEEVFGASPETDELFMAWNYARYVDHVAAAGKAAYDIPLYVNAWLSSLAGEPGGWASGGLTPGDWPSGGPLPHTFDVWLAGAPHIDLLAPDIYQPQFQEWCQQYVRRENPLFIPEMHRNEDGAAHVFYALGEHSAIGVSPFAIDSLYAPEDIHLARSYRVLRQLAPFILAHQGTAGMTGFLLDEERPSVTRELGGYELEISLDLGFDYTSKSGYGLIIADGPDTFIGAGFGFRVAFRPAAGAPGQVGLIAVDEGEFRNGQWIPGRRLNGDENWQGGWWRFPAATRPGGFIPTLGAGTGISRCAVYRYG